MVNIAFTLVNQKEANIFNLFIGQIGAIRIETSNHKYSY